MTALLQRLHTRLGDFWWYSLMIFMAARAADCMNVFVGLWLVPKYVPPSELGAVQPLMNFATFLATPIAVFASTFRQELSNLAVNNQFGKMKTLMRSVFIASGVFLVLAILVSHFLLPHFLERIRIVEGSLGMLIIFYSFINTLAPIFSNALQSLKKFKATTTISLLGAPIRLIAMLLTMPLRALSGYFIGQTSTPAFGIITSIIALRKELSVKAEPYWTRENCLRFMRLVMLFGVGAAASSISTLVECTVLRQRIPELESAAYYITTRFSDITNFVTTALLFTIFPFSADLASKGKDTRPLMYKVATLMMLFGCALAVVFLISGKPILSLLPNGELYCQFAWSIPWVVAITTLTSIASLYSTVEIASNRFGMFWWYVPLTLLYPATLLAVTGNQYYISHISPRLASVIKTINVTGLASILMWMTIYNIVRVMFSVFDCIFRKRN